MQKHLHLIYDLKNYTGKCLAKVLFDLKNDKYSELDLAKRFQSQINYNQELYEKGWYSPPPDGIITIFANREDGFKRVSQPSFRPEYMWPRTDIIYDVESIICLLYTSPSPRDA